MTPNPRNLWGTLILLAGLVLYALLVANLAVLIGDLPMLVEIGFYILFGIAWIFPSRWLLAWMARGQQKDLG